MFFALNSSHFMGIFLMNRVSLNSLNSILIFAPFVVLDSLSSIFLWDISLTLIQQSDQLFFLQTGLYCTNTFL